MKKLVNFRDMGGQKTSDNRTVRYRRLLRAGEPVGLPEEDILQLKNEYNLRIIVDFRSQPEVERVPDDQIDGVEYKNIYLREAGETKAVPPGEKEFRKLRDKELVVRFMIGIYDNLLKHPFTQQAFSRFIEVVRDNTEGAILFHCYAGKDRTGIAAAIIYTLLGVPEDSILSEYLLTNILRQAENEAIIRKIREIDPDEDYLEALKVSYEVRAEYLEYIFNETRKSDGSLLNYIKTHMGVSSGDIDILRENYLQ